MKRFCAGWMFLFCSHAFSQSPIAVYRLEATPNKFTTVVFPCAVKQASVSGKDIVVQVLPAADTVLQLIATRSNFEETGMNVVTADGKLFVFTIRYAHDLAKPAMRFGGDSGIVLPATAKNNYQLAAQSLIVLQQKNFLHAKATHDELKLKMAGAYMLDKTLWFTFEITNESPIGFSISTMQMVLKDRHHAKRTASSETVIPVVYRSSTNEVEEFKTVRFCMAVAPFHLPDGKRLVCTISNAAFERSVSLPAGRRLLRLTRAALP